LDEAHEAGAKFWCYFCSEEVKKHEVSEQSAVLGAGLMTHVSR